MTRPPLFCDLETFSETPINHGTHAYAEKSEVMLWPFAVGDGPVTVWDVTTGKPMPAELEDHLADERVETVWHNGGMFDTVVLPHAMDIHIPIERVHDTMVRAFAHSLPGALGDLCDILKVDTDKAKDKAGRQFIHLFCKPRPATSAIRRATRETHPVEWGRFVEYAALDIHSMREVYKKLPIWNYRGEELALWWLDQKINRRGFAVDMDLVHAAIDAVNKAQKRLAKRTQHMTEGTVQAATQRDALLTHLLVEYGVNLPDMQKSTLERRIADPDLPEAMRELLGIRLQASTTSTSKYKTLERSVSRDGRLRGTTQFCGAGRTGRWAGRLFQPQNLPRPTLDQEDIDVGIEALKAGCADLITDNVMELTSSSIRGCVVAPAKKKLVVSDLSNIEGRDQAWLAGEAWKLQAFRDFDTIIGQDDKGKDIRKGHDLYKLAYAKAFGIRPEDVDGHMRQIGKVMELAMGYEGGVGAFVTFAAGYGMSITELADVAWNAIPQDILSEANSGLAWAKKNKRSTFGLSDREWVVCDSLKRMWRYAHPNITAMWKELGDAVRRAVNQSGTTVDVRGLLIRRDGSWLRIRLPSGRYLCYPSPHVEHDSGQISYMGMNQYSRKWSRLKTYGGKLFENICQAVARDVLAHNMALIEDAGYEIVLTVHDEVICETPDSDEFNVKHLSSLLATNPPWAPDMPLAAAGFETYRYRKD